MDKGTEPVGTIHRQGSERPGKADRRGKPEINTWTPAVVFMFILLGVLCASFLYAVFTRDKDLINIILPLLGGGFGVGVGYLFGNKAISPIVDRREGDTVDQRTVITPPKEETK